QRRRGGDAEQDHAAAALRRQSSRRHPDDYRIVAGEHDVDDDHRQERARLVYTRQHDRDISMDRGSVDPTRMLIATMPQEGTAIRARLGTFYAASFLVVGIQTPFWPVWLAGRGLDAPEIAALFAAGARWALSSPQSAAARSWAATAARRCRGTRSWRWCSPPPPCCWLYAAGYRPARPRPAARAGRRSAGLPRTAGFGYSSRAAPRCSRAISSITASAPSIGASSALPTQLLACSGPRVSSPRSCCSGTARAWWRGLGHSG